MLVQRDLKDQVQTPEGRYHFEKSGSGFPVVMMHPLGNSTWVWESVTPSLSQHYTCYAFDALGHGLSDKPPREFAVPDHARAMDHAMQVLNIHRAHIIGNSFGAIQAVQLAAAHPSRVDKLVLIGLPVWDHRTAPQRLADGAAGYTPDGMPVDRTIADSTTSFHKPTQEWVDRSNHARGQAGTWIKNTMNTLAWFDIVSRLQHIQATATLVVYGEHDPLRELAEDILRYNLPNASKVILPGLAHVPQVEGPEEFLAPVLEFLSHGHIY